MVHIERGTTLRIPGTLPNGMTTLDRLYIHMFPSVDIRKVGKRLGGGMEHHVYDYSENGVDDLVLKVPHRIRHHPQSAFEKMNDYNQIHEYFPGYAIETDFRRSPDNFNYLLLQRKMKRFECLTPTNVKQVPELFAELIKKNQQLMRDHHCSLDFLGKDGIEQCAAASLSKKYTPQISNVVLETLPDGTKKIVIHDLALLRLGDQNGYTPKGVRDRLLFAMTYALNWKFLSQHFGVSIS